MDQFPIVDETVNSNKFIYERELGWSELDEDEERIPAMIIVVDANFGYNIFRIGSDCELLEWFIDREDALDFAVDGVRKEISLHEFGEFTKDD